MKSEGSIIKSLSELVEQMQQQWDSDQFFSLFMKTFGTASSSIKGALSNNRAKNVASQDFDEQVMLRPDLAIPNRVYFRFVKSDEMVRDQLQVVQQLPEFKNSKAKLQFAVCCSPNLMSVYDVYEDDVESFALEQLPSRYSMFLPLTGDYQRFQQSSETQADVKACLKLTRLLDDLIKCNKIDGDHTHEMYGFIRRVLFCLFAEDTDIFAENQFSKAFSELVDKNGINTQQFFKDLFKVLNCPENQRANLANTMAKELLEFPYVNGGLFHEDGEPFVPQFNLSTRMQLRECGRVKWNEISPAIFGAMFQNALDPKIRREMGAHYTSEENILKVINPLFMDDLRAEFEKLKNMEPDARAKDSVDGVIKSRRDLLISFQEKLASLKFLDPACGCGNFLIIAYRELRRLENHVIAEIFDDNNRFLQVGDVIKVSVDQFYGIEIEDWPAEIAHLSMWLMMHVMNQETADKFGMNIPTLPLKTTATIVCANALTTDWSTVLPASECSYILGNPPFAGNNTTTKEQKEWLKNVFPPKYSVSTVDFCSAWFVKAAAYMQNNKAVQAAFVATNSICQGSQVGVLWSLLLEKGIVINFAYKSFVWENAANNAAAVICIIVGFAYKARAKRLLCHTEGDKTVVVTVDNISPYLLPMRNNTIVREQSKALSAQVNLCYGNKAADGGNLILSAEEGQDLLRNLATAPFVKRFMGSSELINDVCRYCLFLKDEDREVWSLELAIMQHVEATKSFREQQVKTGDAYKLRDRPWSFRDQLNPTEALVIPRASSERRTYVPMKVVDESVIVSDSAFMLPNATHYDFGILTSRIHMSWMRLTSGRIKEDYRYSKKLTFNTFIWPEVTDEQRDQITKLAEEILVIRGGTYFDKTLAELYDPDKMPDDLRVAHAALDEAVERLYRERPFRDDEERVSFMLELYTQAVAQQQVQAKAKKK